MSDGRRDPTIARLAPSGQTEGERRVCARHAPQASITPEEATHWPQTHGWQWCGEGRAAEPHLIGARCATAFIGAIPRAASIRSTAATCPWRGGPTLGSARVTRPIRFRSRGRGRSGARRTRRTFAPRACRAVLASGRWPRRPHRLRRSQRLLFRRLPPLQGRWPHILFVLHFIRDYNLDGILGRTI